MPISDEALQSGKNSFLAVSGEATVGLAVAALQGVGGQPWWHLVVRMDDGSWGAARFSQLFESMEMMAGAADIRLGGLKDLIPATAVDRDSLETKAAQALARKSPGKILVVTAHGLPAGILVEGVSRGGPSISSEELNGIGGSYLDLKEYGDILLGSSGKKN